MAQRDHRVNAQRTALSSARTRLVSARHCERRGGTRHHAV